MTEKILKSIVRLRLQSISSLPVYFFLFLQPMLGAVMMVVLLSSASRPTYWLTDTFARKSAVLQVMPLEESHTVEYMAGKYLEMLAEWEITHDQVHLVLCDNAANMAKAMRDASLPSLGCFAHTLQLVVHDGVLSQRVVMDTLAVCRKNVGHFKHSSTAYSRLNTIQQNLGLPQHWLQQDVFTRWNSTLYILQMVAEQKMALAAYTTEYSIPQLTANQLDIVGKVITALSLIEEITANESCFSQCCLSVTHHPFFFQMLSKTMEKRQDDKGVQTMKSEMLASLKRRFSDTEKNECLVVEHYLILVLRINFSVVLVKEMLPDKCWRKEGLGEAGRSLAAQEPSPKRPCTNLWESFSEILEEAGTSPTDFRSEVDIDKYLSEPLLKFHRSNCYTWWAENKERFPALAKLAQRFLSATSTCTSVPSEQLFSGAGEIYYDRRNRLAPERAETLIFIKNNFTVAK